MIARKDTHKTRHQKMLYEIKHRAITSHLMKRNATKCWNNLPQSITYQKTHGKFKKL